MRIPLVILSTLALAAIASPNANASGTIWASNAASCVPTPATNASISAGAVTATGGTSVVLYCRVDANDLRGTAPLFLVMYYKGAKSLVVPQSSTTVALISMDKTTGVETNLGTVTGAGSSTITTGLVGLSFTPDVDNKFYYVRAVITSGNSSAYFNTLYNVTISN